MTRPRLLDLYCGAGGAAMGYSRAGFEVVGVDHRPQPNYPFAFVMADALDADLAGFDAIHASPPCQRWSKIGKQQHLRGNGPMPVDLIDQTRRRLIDAGVPYVIENVEGAPLHNAVRLCGSSFGLDVRRHRLFECSFAILVLPCAHYWQGPRFPSPNRNRHQATGGLSSVVGVYGHVNYEGEDAVRSRAMGIEWMTPAELIEAIPPAYTQHVGEYLLRALDAA